MSPAVLRPGQTADADPRLIGRFLDVIEGEIIPLTREGVRQGNKIFGAALIRKTDLSTILAATNRETENPLWHGEIATINAYYAMVNADEGTRIDPKNTIFLATHEPCTLCASAIAWGGYENVYYLFSHEDSRDAFQIGHDLKILKEVFGHEPGGYARANAYWSAFSLVDLVERCGSEDRERFRAQVARIGAAYAEVSKVYQARKGEARNIPLK
ncbi:MAG: nucleoside deaminase [Paracoccaceae bacterium]|nr:nucleoside deaminase [Paracoccaceae bacterium]